MKNNKFIKFKVKIAIALSAILFLIFIKSLIDKKNVDELEASFVSVYEDRLVVQDHIFRISEMLFRMRILVTQTSSMKEYLEIQSEVIEYHNQILAIIGDFEQTHLTPKEAEYLMEFKELVEERLEIESYFKDVQEGAQGYETSIQRFNADFERVFNDLRELSLIQIQEGEKLTDKTFEIKARSDIWLQFEYAVLFILLIIIAVLIFTNKSIKKQSMTMDK
ncbi:MCP four helix bundle domain-containing protein [Pleomorphovibrio marinus]|uniref:MCP four helix bundle domain-containing protein n=1 Tax=Pleomorphovibrio marinus TaxID=2164132 RepID=UPI000E0B2C97|nr:MCP four helix bundle domain-containing protein [Pleomorphovibrio marinus]